LYRIQLRYKIALWKIIPALSHHTLSTVLHVNLILEWTKLKFCGYKITFPLLQNVQIGQNTYNSKQHGVINEIQMTIMAHTHTNACTQMCALRHTHVYHTCAHTHTHAHRDVCTCAHTHTCIYMYTCTHICTHIHTKHLAATIGHTYTQSTNIDLIK